MAFLEMFTLCLRGKILHEERSPSIKAGERPGYGQNLALIPGRIRLPKQQLAVIIPIAVSDLERCRN